MALELVKYHMESTGLREGNETLSKTVNEDKIFCELFLMSIPYHKFFINAFINLQLLCVCNRFH